MNQWPLLRPLERCRHFCQTWRWAKLSVSQSLIARVSGILWLKRGQRSIIWSTFSLLNCMRLALNHLKYSFLAKLNEIGLYANSTYIERLTIQHLLGGSFWKKSWTKVSNTSYLTLNLTPSLAPGSPRTRNRRVVEQIASVLLSKGLPRPCSNCWCCGRSSGKPPRWCRGSLRRGSWPWSQRLAAGIHFVSCPNWRRVLLSIFWCSAPS